MRGKVFMMMLIAMMSGFTGFAQQSVNDYSYIEVPEIFEFLKGKDQYQLNSLTKFLFNKYGFNAYFDDELPNVKKCDGLYAVVEGKPGFIYTRITVIVKDCNGVELLRSVEGKSKYKEYKKAYHQALRRAFDSFADVGVNQPEINVDEAEDDTPVITNTKPVSSTQITNAKTTTTSIKNTMPNMPSAKFSSYTHNGTSYLLRKTAMGYSLSQEVAGTDDDLLLVGRLKVNQGSLWYTNVLGVVSKATFDTKKNLIIHLTSGPKVYEIVSN